MPFIKLEKFFSSLWRVFCQEFFAQGYMRNGCWILWNDFFLHLLWRLYGFFFLVVVNIVSYINWFLNAKETLNYWYKPYLVMLCYLLYIIDYYLQDLVMNFYIYFHDKDWSVVFFSHTVFVWFWYQNNLDLME